LLIGEDAGIGPILSLAERLRGEDAVEPADHREQAHPLRWSPEVQQLVNPAGGDRASSGAGWKPLVLLGSDQPFPFRARPSTSHSGFPGCFEGSVAALADVWLTSLGPLELSEVEIFASGPPGVLDMAGVLAARYAVPFHISLAPQ
jgi:dihydroorotate dehydrogenase electron transfer subunit